MVRCIDCGFCAYYINLLSGLRWYEMDRPTRQAFLQNQERNPPGQSPGTGHWNYVRCAKYLQEWAKWDDGASSPDALKGAILKERDCDGFAEHKAGLTPQEHPSFGQPDDSDTQERLEYDVFLSHSSEDDELAQRVRTLLEASGIRAFATPGSIPSGLWNPKIERALQRSEHLWLLLTPAALNRSIWAHQEFGYFCGYKRALDPENADQRLHYLEVEGNTQRPGMYAHFQATLVSSFEDPVVLARIIAQSLGKAFTAPENPEDLKLTSLGWTAIPPEGLDDLKIKGTSNSAASDYSYGISTIDVYAPRPIFNVSAVTWHPQVHVAPLRQVPQIGSSQKQQLSLKVEWTPGAERPQEVQDSYQRRFPLHRPRDPGAPWAPLYITFEAQSGELWAAVAYMRVDRHQHGHPETQLLPGPNPYGWVKGRRFLIPST